MTALVDSLWAPHAALLLYATARVGGVVAVAPCFGELSGTWRVRLAITLCLATFVWGLQAEAPPSSPRGRAHLVSQLAGELVLGLSIGLVVRLLFSAYQLAGGLMSQVAGLQIASLYDPAARGAVSLHGRLLELVALAVLLGAGGHRTVVRAALDSFRMLPIGEASGSEDLTLALLSVAGMTFDIGFRLAAPVLAAVLVASLAVGLIGRTLPQINALTVGLGTNSLIVAGMLFLSLGGLVWVFPEQLEATLNNLSQWLAPVDPAAQYRP